MTFRNSGSGENGSASATTVQITLTADIEVGDIIVIGLKWTGTGHTAFTPSSSNGGSFTALTAVLADDTSSRAQAWQRTAIVGDASSTITIDTNSSGRVACVWVAHQELDGSDPVIQIAFNVSDGDMVFPAADPRVAWGSDGGEVIYTGLARTISGGQTVHSAGASGTNLRITVTNGAGSGNNANAGIFDTTFVGSGSVASVTTAADPDTAGRNTITLLYHAPSAGGTVNLTPSVISMTALARSVSTILAPPILLLEGQALTPQSNPVIVSLSPATLVANAVPFSLDLFEDIRIISVNGPKRLTSPTSTGLGRDGLVTVGPAVPTSVVGPAISTLTVTGPTNKTFVVDGPTNDNLNETGPVR